LPLMLACIHDLQRQVCQQLHQLQSSLVNCDFLQTCTTCSPLQCCSWPLFFDGACTAVVSLL
jgi:hypothetical protein